MNEAIKIMRGLETKWARCRKCRIGSWAFQHVFGKGAVPAKLLFVGEGPGVTEDALGEPFVGKSGRLLRSVLQHIFKKNEYYVTNLVACRPCDGPGEPNRAPDPGEIRNCHNRLASIVHLVDPEIVVAVGNVAMDELDRFYNGRLVKIYHPAYVLRNGGRNGDLFAEWVESIHRIRRALYGKI